MTFTSGAWSDGNTIRETSSAKKACAFHANHGPVFSEDTVTRSLDEGAAAGANVGSPVTATDDDDDLICTLGGADASSFAIDADTGQITVRTGTTLDYETKSSYEVVVTATDPADASDNITVTIHVNNLDESGTVRLSTTTPKQGIAVTASLTDPDGGVTGTTWQWSNSDDGNDWADISGATDPGYTPQGTDAGKRLRATASDTDGEGSSKSASAVNGPVQPGGIDPPRAARFELELTPPTINESGPDNATTVTAILDRTSGADTAVVVSVIPSDPVTLSSNTTLTILADTLASVGAVTITAINDNRITGNRTIIVRGKVSNNPEVIGLYEATLILIEDDTALRTPTAAPRPTRHRRRRPHRRLHPATRPDAHADAHTDTNSYDRADHRTPIRTRIGIIRPNAETYRDSNAYGCAHVDPDAHPHARGRPSGSVSNRHADAHDRFPESRRIFGPYFHTRTAGTLRRAAIHAGGRPHPPGCKPGGGADTAVFKRARLAMVDYTGRHNFTGPVEFLVPTRRAPEQEEGLTSTF